MKDIVIIGGGASGLICAITSARRGKKVTIIEKNDKCGKKLLITGNGRCNYYNDDQDITHYHSSSSDLHYIINHKNEKKILDFFDSLGIIPKIKNGYYYPFTNMAITIWKALTDELKRLNIEVIYNCEVLNIYKKNYFTIETNKKIINCKKIVLSCGSKAASKTGSNGSGYIIAKNLGHNIIEVKPSLTSLFGNDNYFKKWSGVRCEATLSLYEDDKFIKKETGEVQLTDYGISGIVSFNLSRYVSLGLGKHKMKILINFMPWLKESAYSFIKNKSKELKLPIKDFLDRFINYKLVPIILNKSNIKANSFKKLSDNDFKNLIYNLTSFKVDITKVNSFEKAQTCLGGVNLSEINLTTMESKIVNNLYFTGEILDVDGDCGGYNLSFAWISGIIAGENI